MDKPHELHLSENGFIYRFLLKNPETGMGYHDIEIGLRNGLIITDIQAINSSIILLPKEHSDVTEDDILRITVIYVKKSTG